jgi:hypothetical protein
MAYLEGSSPKEKLKKAWLPGMKNNFLVWPWVQAVNFKFVPLEHRVGVVNVVALGKWRWRWWCVREGVLTCVQDGIAILAILTVGVVVNRYLGGKSSDYEQREPL